ncbi:type II secretion system protein [Phycisphaera mikurensis]|uniref:Prepilin-type N-terminal cleavage/methylation domain-containing protein n=1 Tax=Phycisphaera mikurensis (strain NBRC 102666 / KCTC 22515 / FYK2301M01) TaxID=1142394 RepID=I0IIB2_PHYMF|nr:type II secretion system protein [Phycisphaera mikurensis]MBB6442437.1 prepilin-type N-terminal cleavage/methylation domain-containing protein [Phycisphaera mikurensis]BAM05000.1 hypothetical protein PSMK_28410 [Phycisphaera mikurensis NBRC 102666]
MTKRHPRRRACAFTILELLVVMGIIGLLAALAVPVMTKAYGVAAETQCVSNIRSLGQAYAAYTVDAKRRFPAGVEDSARVDPVWYVNMAGDRGSNSDRRNIPAEQRALHHYLGGDVAVAVCPLDRSVVDYSTPTVADLWGTSYVMMNNQDDRLRDRVERNGIWSLEGFGLQDVTSPATKSVMTDFIQLRNLAAGEQNAWHGEEDGHLRSSMAFVDGHAEVLRLKEETANPRRQDRRSRGFIEGMAKADPYY